MATSGKYCDGLVAIQLDWSLDDLVHAHYVLDSIDEAEAIAAGASGEG